MPHTRLCKFLGIEFPILCAPMGPDVSGPELVAAVSNAGGLGIMQAQLHPPPLLRQAAPPMRGGSSRRWRWERRRSFSGRAS
jgi:NAD(P)H-dependent flavin oxidoreductase YrpB (nitropropane dioxygenase family)